MGNRHSSGKKPDTEEDARLKVLDDELKQAQLAQQAQLEDLDLLNEELKFETRMTAIDNIDFRGAGPDEDLGEEDLELGADELEELEADLELQAELAALSGPPDPDAHPHLRAETSRDRVASRAEVAEVFAERDTGKPIDRALSAAEVELSYHSHDGEEEDGEHTVLAAAS